MDLSNDFLRFARVTDLHREPTDLGEVVTRMVDFLGPTARAQGVEINWYPAADLPPVLLDTEMFEKVLLNLMLNAEDAMPDGGTLTLQARAEDGWVVLDVIDTGCGMDAELAAQVFKPFVTTKPGGNGLGLATARKIVRAHGGEIDRAERTGPRDEVHDPVARRLAARRSRARQPQDSTPAAISPRIAAPRTSRYTTNTAVEYRFRKCSSHAIAR